MIGEWRFTGSYVAWHCSLRKSGRARCLCNTLGQGDSLSQEVRLKVDVIQSALANTITQTGVPEQAGPHTLGSGDT